MSEPTQFLAVQHMRTALLAISVERGYHFTVGGLAVKLDPNQDMDTLLGDVDVKQRPFLVLVVEPDEFEYQPANRVKVKTPVTIHAIHDSNPEDDLDWMRVWARLCADVEQSIAQDISRGGLAVDTRIQTRDFHTVGGRQVWAIVKTKITEIRTYGAPNG